MHSNEAVNCSHLKAALRQQSPAASGTSRQPDGKLVGRSLGLVGRSVWEVGLVGRSLRGGEVVGRSLRGGEACG